MRSLRGELIAGSPTVFRVYFFGFAREWKGTLRVSFTDLDASSMRCRSLVTLVGEKSKTRQKTTKKKALERENGSSGCKVQLGDGT